MDKNILLGIIVIILIICLYYNIYDQFTSINENYENIVQSKYANNMIEKTFYEKIMNSTAKTIKLIPKINYGIKLSEYEIYNNTNNLIVSILSKKKEDNKDVEDDNIKKPSIFETFYERVMGLKPNTINSKSLIENATSGSDTEGEVIPEPASGTVTSDKPASGTVTSDKPASGTVTSDKPASGTVTLEPATGTVTPDKPVTGTVTPDKPEPEKPWTQEADIQTQIFGINILFWAVCFLISVGVIYVIVQNGGRVFKSMGFNKINRAIELTPTESSLVDELSSRRTTIGGNNIYYTGGYDINLYSE